MVIDTGGEPWSLPKTSYQNKEKKSFVHLHPPNLSSVHNHNSYKNKLGIR